MVKGILVGSGGVTSVNGTQGQVQAGTANLLSRSLMGASLRTIDDERSISKYGYFLETGQSLWNDSIATFESDPLPFIRPGETYTLSATMWTTGDNVQVSMDFFPDTLPQSPNFTVTATPQRFSFTASSDLEAMKNCQVRFIMTYPSGAITQSNRVYATDIKLERGNVATDWSSGPEDMQVGSRNLLIGTNQGINNWAFGSQDGAGTIKEVNLYGSRAMRVDVTMPSTGWIYVHFTDTALKQKILPNQGYTLSFDAISDMDIHALINVANRNSNVGQLAKSTMYQLNGDQTVHRVVAYIRANNVLATDTDDTNGIQIGLPNNKTGYMIISNLKLERDFVATDWTPAPEDIIIGENLIPARAIREAVLSSGVSVTGSENDYVITLDAAITNPVFKTGDFFASAGLKEGASYTLSFYAEADGTTKIYTDLYNVTNNEVYGNVFANSSFDVSTAKKKYVVSGPLKFAGNPSELHIRFWRMAADAAETIRITKVKLERGVIPTEWCLAPEDVVTSVNDTTGEIKVGGTNILRGTGNIVLSSDLWPAGTWSAVRGDTSADLAELIEVNNPLAPEITTGVRINNPVDVNTWNGINQHSIPVMKGQTYTMSCYARITKGSCVLNIQYDGVGGERVGTNYPLSGEWKRYSATYTFAPNYSGNTAGAAFYMGNGSDCTIEICGMKLELGTVATDWSPSPYDKQDALTNGTGCQNILLGTNQGVNNWFYNSLDGTGSLEAFTYNGSRGIKATTTKASTNWIYVHFINNTLKDRIVPGQEYIISFYAMSDTNIDRDVILANPNNTMGALTNQAQFHLDGDGKPHKIVLKTRAKEVLPSDTDNRNGLQIHLVSNATFYIAIWDLQVERGPIATDWSPAPQDFLLANAAAASANKLATPRNINDVPFDGTANIDIPRIRSIDLTGKTQNLDELNMSTQKRGGAIEYYVCTTIGGASNITGSPVSGQPFSLMVRNIRLAGSDDYTTEQRFITTPSMVEYQRFCTSGAWTPWKELKYTDTAGTSTTSDITGLLKGSGGKVVAAEAGEDYLPADNPTFTGVMQGVNGRTEITLDTELASIHLTKENGNSIVLVPSSSPNTLDIWNEDIGRQEARLGNLADPVNDDQAANKGYVDQSIQQAIQSTWEASY